MYIDVIEDMDAFSQLRENWDEHYDADPHATLFLSWNWLFPGWKISPRHGLS